MDFFDVSPARDLLKENDSQTQLPWRFQSVQYWNEVYAFGRMYNRAEPVAWGCRRGGYSKLIASGCSILDAPNPKWNIGRRRASTLTYEAPGAPVAVIENVSRR